MITTVKNTRGYNISLLNMLISVASVATIGVFGHGPELHKIWFIFMGFLLSSLIAILQIVFIARRQVYSRLSMAHGSVVLISVFGLIVFLVYAKLLDGCEKITDPALIDKVNSIMIAYGLSAFSGFVLLISIAFKNGQVVQTYLHPFIEIIDGFSKSSGSIQMNSISSAQASQSSLKQVVVEREAVSPSSKADGSSPKPSRVLKTWPKAEPFPVKALYSFKSTSASELAFRKGDSITVLDCRGRWWQAQMDDKIGFIPSNYVVVLLKARVASSFTAIDDDQVSIKKDEVIEVMERYDERCLVRNCEDKIGAVPTDRLEFLSTSS